MRSNFANKNLYQQKQGNDILTMILHLKWDKVIWTKRIEYGISNCAKKKVKTRPYSILIQKSKGSRAFD